MANTEHPALGYHRGTSHVRDRIPARGLNWGAQPIPFKLYHNVSTFHLTQELSLPDTPLDQAMNPRPLNPKTTMPTLLAGVCNLAAGITRIRKQDGGLIYHFRTMPSAGALYPTELYMALQNVSGMNDGLYHFCPLEHVMTPLRQGQIFSALAGTAPIIRFYMTSVFHRSAWKYGPRAYRYCLLDAGHMSENLLLAARMHGLPAKIDYDFNDSAINEFLCIDPAYEGCLATVHAIGCSAQTQEYNSVPPAAASFPAYSQCARKCESPPELAAVHAATAAHCTGPMPVIPPPDEKSTRLPEPDIAFSASKAMQTRASRRNFIRTQANPRALIDVLGILCTDPELPPPCLNAVQTGFLAAENSGFTPGFHLLDRRTRATTLIKPGHFMRDAARICLDQGWMENAALHLVFTADIKALEHHCGPRAYRYAHLEAGRLGERAYLAATAKKFGACGIGAFYDNEAAALLNLPDGHELLYLVALGPVKK